jgi:hypothetical protein
MQALQEQPLPQLSSERRSTDVGSSEPPTEVIDYAVFNVAFGAAAGAVLVAARRRSPPAGADHSDLVWLGLGTFALAKLIAKEKAGVWVRAPFVEDLREDDRRPRGARLRYAAGELVTCTRCVGSWAALGLVGLSSIRPREARLLTAVLATSAANDFLQAAFSRLCASANSAKAPEAHRRAS